jgi:glycosyltransferase involved in cell wall biosynthesis
MKIAWITPLGVQSAIAEYSIHITQKLAETCEVLIWASDPPPWRTTSVPTTPLLDSNSRELAAFDARVYHLGDHAAFHRRAYEASRRHPGYCVLHDRAYQSLFSALLVRMSATPERYVEVMARHYGEKGRQAALDSIRGTARPVWDSPEESLRFSLEEELLARALGAVVHSENHRRSIVSRWWGPVGRVHFPAYRQTAPRAPRPKPERVTFVTIGHLNPNKQLHRVIEAFGRDTTLRAQARYVAAGPVNAGYVARLSRLIGEHRLEESVEIRPGFRPEDEVAELRDRADVFVNLREPSSESASASLMEQLACGAAIVASDNGWRTELPEGAVLKIPEGDDARLIEALRILAADERLRARIGYEGWRFAMSQTVQLAVEGYLDFIERAPAWKPALGLADRVGEELAGMGVTTGSASIPVIARRIAEVVVEP